MRVSLSLRFILLLLVVFAVGCHRDKKTDDAEVLPVDQMYSTAKTALMENNLNKAIKYYERLIARFPFGPYTERWKSLLSAISNGGAVQRPASQRGTTMLVGETSPSSAA